MPSMRKVLCDHTPQERRQSPEEMKADMEADALAPLGEFDRRALLAIWMNGEDGYATAANLIGPDKADDILADFLSRDCRKKGIRTSEDWVRRRVAEVRKAKWVLKECEGNTP